MSCQVWIPDRRLKPQTLTSQESMFGPDPWEYGLTARNLKTLETLVGYSYEQGLIKRKIPMDELFLNVSQGARRGDEFTF
jgi:4,5-dihydroxyphthalate decarboxylase